MTAITSGRIEKIYDKAVKACLNDYMGLIFEKMCKDYLLYYADELGFQIVDIGQWWGTDSVTRTQIEIDLIANDGREYLVGECKWRNEKLDLSVLQTLKEKADVFSKNRDCTWFFLFSLS